MSCLPSGVCQVVFGCRPFKKARADQNGHANGHAPGHIAPESPAQSSNPFFSTALGEDTHRAHNMHLVNVNHVTC